MKPHPILFIPCLALMLASLACVQDCGGTTFDVKGIVTDVHGDPIVGAVVWIENQSCFEIEPIKRREITNARGEFRFASLYLFACCPFNFSVRAPGYHPLVATYHPQSGYDWLDQIPMELHIVLQSSS